MNKSIKNEPQQPSILQFLDNRVGHYSMSHPQKKGITNAIQSDLIIDCNLPVYCGKQEFSALSDST